MQKHPKVVMTRRPLDDGAFWKGSMIVFLSMVATMVGILLLATP